MTAEELLIHELAERAGISVRTIRYYIEEGLLPQPAYQGKYSYYTLNYLDRLELIRRLKDSYLPLREIREIMSSLTDDQIRIRLKELPPLSPKFSAQSAPAQPGPKPGAKALEYIDRLMEDQTRHKIGSTSEKPQSRFRKEREKFLEVNQPIHFQAEVQSEETWSRVSIAPGVELNLRQPMDDDTERQVHQLIDFARRLFQKKP